MDLQSRSLLFLQSFTYKRERGKCMKFRPCIDIHNGKVKQIVGGSLRDEGDRADTNFVSELDAAWYAEKYRKDGLRGGHIILLNSVDSEFYEATRRQAAAALEAYPGGLQIGGGITAQNAADYLDAGASHVIITSWIFQNGKLDWERVKTLKAQVGRDNIVLDLSCRKKDAEYYVVTDRWQTFTDVKVDFGLLEQLSEYCAEFLIHGVDVEGKASGVECGLVKILGKWKKTPVTYAGGIGTLDDLEIFQRESGGEVDFTIGSALDLFGGKIPYELVKKL